MNDIPITVNYTMFKTFMELIKKINSAHDDGLEICKIVIYRT